MKFKLIAAALLSVAGIAIAQPHNHQQHHRHPARPSKVERALVRVTDVLPGPVQTIYMLNGKVVAWDDVQEGLASGRYVLVGDSVQLAPPATPTPPPPATPTPPPPTATPTPPPPAAPQAPPPAAPQAPPPAAPPAAPQAAPPADPPAAPHIHDDAKFVQSPKSSDAPKASNTPLPSIPYNEAKGSNDDDDDDDDHKDSKNWPDFPSGTIPCSTFPSKYGPVAIDYLNLDGWIGLQSTPDYTPKSSAIFTINTLITGGCVEGSFCSYACPIGYQKSQWPSAQGSTGQSIGGIYCNSQGMLELSRPSVKQLCVTGSGSVKVKNKLDNVVSVCRTDYPGLEAETVPLPAKPGKTYDMTCPDAKDYYSWEGLPTSAQYYINPQGIDPSKACVWGAAGGNVGNWAPVNAGVGRDAAGKTWLSLIPNHPTNTYGKLDFTITIEGDVSGKCSYKDGTYYNNGVESPTGCTVAVNTGGTATYVFS